ncbi:hypothetical protein [Nocardia mikamii]|uniref:hypothetical protein n=1 Tax=Nocardia mikamii TaxID=508464 RepID=UPI0007A4D830|nr:hypothetical protein [Nocardia mikamii]
MTHAEVVQSLKQRWPDFPDGPNINRPHVVYSLGPELPGMPIPTSKPYRAARLWVLLDQLLTSASLAEAVEHTKKLTTLGR